MIDKAISIIKEVSCMKFYNEMKPIYIEADFSGVVLGTTLLQTRSNNNHHMDEAQDNSILRPIAFPAKT